VAGSRDDGLGTTGYVYSSQKLAEQALGLGIVTQVVSHLFCYGVRSVVDIPFRSSVAFTFLVVLSRENGILD